MLMGGNYMLADASSTRKEEVLITGKTIETRNQTYRRRHFLTTRRPQKNYYFTVRFHDGTDKKIPVSHTAYYRFRENMSMELDIQKGFFGLRVIKIP